MIASVSQIHQIIHADLICHSPSNQNHWRIETDSRHIISPENTLFIALNGSHHQGIKFIPDLIKKGVKTFIVDQEISPIPNINILKVKNCLHALQSLANFHRHNFNIPIVGITGSNGKTIIKEWLSQILSQTYNVCKSPKSYNSQLGVALSLLELNEKHEFGIFEAGISRKNEMERLFEMIDPTIGILSNIGDAHDEGFLSREEKLLEKIKLFKNSKKIYYNGDQEILFTQLKSNPLAISWGKNKSNQIIIKTIIINQHLAKVNIDHNSKTLSFELPFIDEASLENIIPCILVALDFNITSDEIQSSIHKLHGMKMRLEQKEGINNCILINDSYSLDIKSLQLSFQFADQQNKNLERVLIISDFYRQHSDDTNYHELLKLIQNYHFKIVIAVGTHIKKLKELLPTEISFTCFSTTEDLLANLDQYYFKNQLILIKGARIYKLERVFEELSLSNHESILEINLKALAHNISIYKSYLKPNTKIIAVVKASAYGSGNYEVAKYLEHLGVQYLAVAYQDEALVLRNKGIQTSIIVLNSGLSDFETLFENKIEPVIFSIQQLQRLIKETKSSNTKRIHLKLDTGMRRLGFMKEDLNALLKILSQHKEVTVISIFSHLAGSESMHFDKFTIQQFQEFEYMYDEICKGLEEKPFRHILNSGGISRHPNLQLDAIRMGIGMYGIDSNPSVQIQLQKAHKLKTKITQIKKVKAEDRVSYNQSGQLDKDGKIAILSIGYADGLPRISGLMQHQVYIKNKKCPLVGLVCMDMCMVDISDVSNVNEADEVEIFGEHISLESISKKTNRIPYEILCGISSRVKRVFIEE